MRIEELRTDRLSSEVARPAQTGPAPAQPPAPVDHATRGDSVLISPEARALAAGEPELLPTGSLPADRVAELRRWLAEGGHNDASVLRSVAQRLLDHGEFDDPPPRSDT